MAGGGRVANGREAGIARRYSSACHSATALNSPSTGQYSPRPCGSSVRSSGAKCRSRLACAQSRGDLAVLDAREALRKHDRARLEADRAIALAERHPLAPWVEYWEL